MTDREHHQPDSLNSRQILMVGFGLIALLFLLLAGLYVALELTVADRRLVAPEEEWLLGESSPGVKPNQSFDYQQQLDRQIQQLNSYAWQDDDHSLARVPVERAMRLLAQDHEFGFQPTQNSLTGQAAGQSDGQSEQNP